MSPVWRNLVTILCLCTALSDQGSVASNGVVWRKGGEAVTIQCRSSQNNEEYLTVKKALSREIDVMYKDVQSEEPNIAPVFTGRLQLSGPFPSVDILIQNLTSDDTGLYWCVYKRFDFAETKAVMTKGNGSVLLVVTDVNQECTKTYQHLVLVSVIISAAVLFGIVIGTLIWSVLKAKTLRTTAKPRHRATNDVYEDMRGTLRR